MADVIRWEEPPLKHGNARPRPSAHQPLVDALKARPGEWALIAEGKAPGSAGSMAHRIKTGGGPWGPARSFEARCVGPAGGTSSKVYARYVGEPS